MIKGFTLAEGAEPLHHKVFWSKGFTLSEVLITLGIIGVVAAMTIPTLVQNYQERAWKTSAEVFESKLEQALKTMNTQQTLAGYKNTEDFVNELSKHFKISKICKNDALTDCFEDKVYWGNEEIGVANLTTAGKFGQKDWYTKVVGAQFANGTTGLIAYNPNCKQEPYSNQINGTSCLAILYDTSGNKSPNTQNKDLRGINIKTLDGSTCVIELSDGTCFTAAFFPTALSKADCEAQKVDLGIKECYYDNDYWAGAVKACGGISKMPTQAQITAIANELYDKPISGSLTTIEYANWNKDKADSMGFDTITSNYFYIWSGEEIGENMVSGRYFHPTYTYYCERERNGGAGYRQAICLAD